MHALKIESPAGKPLTLLCLGAHCDDIEIGAGGTVLKLLADHPAAVVHWIVFSGDATRKREATTCARGFVGDRDATIVVHDFRDGFFPYQGAEIKEAFEGLKPIDPDLILTHWSGDAHQDHRLLNELTWNTFRNHMILEYEIPKYDGGLGSPNVFIPLDEAHRAAKNQTLMSRFASQRDKLWFTPETFDALARLRGIECNAPSGYAEAFYCRKAVF